ncbi:hypothetical protein ACFU5O_32325 [Streptomyces sp. NPDC057445]|uniref:hypothetical protein n=1 Tax=Streptomyces sp. NPDC057445 TaxID=3346136 RepID=UPI0036CAA40E
MSISTPAAASAPTMPPAGAFAPSPLPAPAVSPAMPTPAVAAVSATTAPTGTGREPRYPQIPARAGNANVRALLAHGTHPASRQPLADAPGTGCGTCTLAYRLQLPAPGGDGTVRERVKCTMAPVSRRGRQGIDLRPANADQPGTPACTLHCTHTDWPFDPDGHDQTADDALGHAQDHPDNDGVYAVYRIFGIDLEHQRVWVELVSTMIPHTTAAGAHISRAPHRSKPAKPHLYRFWTDLSRLHTARIHHPTDAGQCAHQLVLNGRVLRPLRF